MRLRAVLPFLGGVLLCVPAVGGQTRGSEAAWGVRTTDGRPLAQLASPGQRAVVLFFVATDCPISNRTFPEMRRLREEFGPQGIRFWSVYPNAGEQAGEIARHQAAFDPKSSGDAGGPALQDPSGALVRLSHAVATPEMVILASGGAGWHPVYAGRIDDRYVHLGLERPAVTRRFGEEALRAVVAGRTPPHPVGAPVGCAIINPGAR